MSITLNCIAVAIVTGLVTVITLIAVVLVINSGTATADVYPATPACGDGDTPCLVYHRKGKNNDDTRFN